MLYKLLTQPLNRGLGEKIGNITITCFRREPERPDPQAFDLVPPELRAEDSVDHSMICRCIHLAVCYDLFVFAVLLQLLGNAVQMLAPGLCDSQLAVALLQAVVKGIALKEAVVPGIAS